MAARLKIDRVLEMKPDLLILQECSRADIAAVNAKFSYWVGHNPNKGLGVLGFGNHTFEIDESFQSDLTWFIPLRVTDLSIHVLALWASRTTKKDGYVREAHKALNHYEHFLRSAPSVVLGDFNSNTIWDHLHPGQSHSDLVTRFEFFGLASLYHSSRGELQGNETTSTFFMYRKPDRGYHIDYVFVSRSILNQTKLDIPLAADWLKDSDHVPIIVTI